jgi:uncharacterized protein (DUF924 family)
MPETEPGLSPAAAGLLRFWFGTGWSGGQRRTRAVSARILARWRALGVLHLPGWTRSPAADRRAASRFAGLLEVAGTGGCDGWLETPAGRLAYILLCDQLPRSIHRGTACAYAFDERARRAALAALAAGDDRRFGPIEQVFLVMPLMHAEDVLLQREADGRIAALSAAATPSLAPLLGIFREAVQRHRTIIETFGRFPNRNPVLGRLDTELEGRFLRDPWVFFAPAAREAPAGAAHGVVP